MFLYQVVEELTFEDVVHFYEEDRDCAYLRRQYEMGEADRDVFLTIKRGVEGYRTSLKVLDLEEGMLKPRVMIKDEEGELEFVEGYEVEEIARMPVCLDITARERSAMKLVIMVILMYTLDRKKK